MEEPEVWREMQAATWDRTHGWRSPVMATIGDDGAPDARTLVLRSADFATRWLVFFTDTRSPKVAQLQRDPRAQLVFWCPRLRWQLRVQAEVNVDSMSDKVQEAWSRIRTTGAAREYLAPVPPGAALPQGEAHEASAEAPHFSILRAGVLGMDLLLLARHGAHQRFRYAHGRLQQVQP